MINKSMFFADAKIENYRDMKLDDILREHLLFKGTIGSDGTAENLEVKAKDLVSSGLFIYNLKANATNKQAIIYYCEREAQRRGIMSKGYIIVPPEIWKECDAINRDVRNRRDRHAQFEGDIHRVPIKVIKEGTSKEKFV